MTYVALTLSALALLLVVRIAFVNERLTRALRAAERREHDANSIVVNAIDLDGQLAGRLALPDGNPAVTELAQARTVLAEAAQQLTEARAARDEAQRTLAEVVDPTGAVLAQLRLPGQKISPPNRTPCALCRYYWSYEDIYGYRTLKCQAAQERLPDARRQFLDADAVQCTMFERKS